MYSNKNTTLVRTLSDGLNITTLQRPAFEEFHITLTPINGESPTGMLAKLADAIGNKNARVVSLELFGLP
ncbi:MAG: hypothetical protein ACYTF1_24480, partial [Planctomycetota bacterium]